MFPPGTIHAVYTDEDSVFCGGHFLVPQIMDRFLEVLGQTEMDPHLTNDSKAVDFFQVLENFIKETLSEYSQELTKSQLYSFILVFKDYLKLIPPIPKKDRQEQGHLKRRKVFVAKAEKENWVAQLENKMSDLGW